MTPERIKQTCEECAQLSLGVNTRAKLEALRDLALKGLQVEAMRGELKLLQCANEAASFEQGLAERAGEIEAMREAIKRAVDDMNNWSLVQGKTLSGICADLEQALNEGKP